VGHQSFHDWPRYEKVRDALRAAEMDVRGAATAAEYADMLHRRMPENQPLITPPDPDWDCELTKAWPEIERLAESLLNGESPIDLSNGQLLVRDEDRDYWSNRWKRLTAGSVRACWKHCGYFGAARRRPRSPEHCCRPREGLRGIAGRGAQPQISLAGRSAQPQMRRR
jgi:hypothetical protein